MEKSNIKKVHVVFKTHLDIGFTNLGQTVLDAYVNEHIPHAVDLAEKLNTDTEKKFIWTVGSYLIDYYFRNADEKACKKLEKAIERGDICWHGLSSTTHTELLDEDLFHFGLRISDELDERFGKKTIATKMTDVPGHTKAIIGMMSEHNKRYLHIGVNASSMVPDVPQTFLWKSGEDELIVQYSFEYGTPCYVEGMDEILEFAHTEDNMGPQSKEAVEEELERIQKLYPEAKVVASTLDAYAESLLKYKSSLPVIEEEIGDTWIHGVGSDPLKVMRYRTLVELKNRWQSEGKLSRDSEYYYDFMINLLLITEHTWGLDYKKYLADFTNWEKKDFNAARKADKTTLDFLTNRNAQMLAVLKDDFKKYREEKFEGSYKFYESSHAEQMQYVWNAVESLPDDMKEDAKREFASLEAGIKVENEDTAKSFHPYEHIKIGAWEITFSGSGELVYLAKNGQEWITDGCFGRFVYSTYNAVDCVNNYYSYNRAFRANQSWSEPDFSKPGLEFVEDLEHREYLFGVSDIFVQGDKVTLLMHGNKKAVEQYGAPASATIQYKFEEEITCKLSWKDKDANRMPEALWFDMNFDVENPYCWKMTKMGKEIAPLEVVKGGNRRQHCVEEMRYNGADGKISVKNVHSPLMSVGGRWLYGNYRELPNINDGFSYCLFNNKWGTNFKMWCEDDCTFEYIISIENSL